MNQQDLWKKIWSEPKQMASNNFARRSFSDIKNKPFKTLLDLGCGIGADSIFFSQHGLDVTSVDFSESGIQQLKEQVSAKNIDNITPVVMDISKLDFPPNSFDVIYAHLSLHYFDDQTTTSIFDEVHTILKPKGVFFVKCKSIEDSLYGVGQQVDKDMFDRDGHVRHFFSKEYMAEKLDRFDIIKIGKTSSTYSQYKSSFVEAIATK